MAPIPKPEQHSTVAAIVRWYESKPQEHRPHMGASIIGHPCDRHIWLTWRWALTPQFEGRILRLFDTGKREEARLLEELRAIGAEVWDNDPATGDQWRVAALDGHFGGSLDGIAQGLPEGPKTPAVLEFKTHSHKSFMDLLAKRVREAKPQHFDQMTVYMGLMDLTRALYMAVDKDTDDVYVEWVELDRDRFQQLIDRAQRLIETAAPPARLSEDPTHWQCKFCGFYKHCHQGVAAEANCRTCAHCSPAPAAAWRCERHDGNVPLDFQRVGCDQHLLIPGLVPYAAPVDGGDAWVAYRHRESGKPFVNGPVQPNDPVLGPSFSSRELHLCPGSLLPAAADIKAEMGGTVVPRRPFDDIPDDIPTAAQTKPAPAAKRQNRKAIGAALKAMEAGQ